MEQYRYITFEGKTYKFPGDATDEEVSKALDEYTKPPAWGAVASHGLSEIKRSAVEGMAGAARALGDITGIEALQESGKYAQQGVTQERQEETPRNMTFPQEVASSAITSAGLAIPSLLAGTAAAAGAPTVAAATAAALGLGTTFMGAQTGLQRYSQLREAGAPPARAGVHAAWEGLVEKYTEYLPMKEVLKGNMLVKAFRNYLGKELLGEEVATTLQDISAKLSDNPDMTLGDYLRDLAVTAGAVPLAGAAQFAIARGVVQPMAEAIAPRSQAEAVGAKPPSALDNSQAEQPGKAAETNPITAMLQAGTVMEAEQLAEDSQDQSLRAVEEGKTTTLVVEPEKPTAAQAVDPLAAADATAAELATPSPDAVFSPAQPPLAPPVATASPLATPQASSASAAAQPTGAPSPTSESTRPEAEPATTETAKNADGTPLVAPPQTVAEATKGRRVKRMSASDTTVISINRGNAGTVQGVFPNVPSKNLWMLGRALWRQATGLKIPVAERDLEALRRYVLQEFKWDPQFLDERAVAYFEAERRRVQSAPKDKTFSFRNPLEIPLEKVAPEVNASVPEGVSISAGMQQTPWVKQMAALLTQWHKRWAPTAKIVVAGFADANADARIEYQNGVHYVFLPQPMKPGINNTVQKVYALIDLAHEFGHIVIDNSLDDPRWAAAREQLRRAYEDMLQRKDSMTIEQYIGEFWNPAKVAKVKKLGWLFGHRLSDSVVLMARDRDRAVGMPGYTFSWEEFLAEQFARHVASTPDTSVFTTPEVKSFWKEIVEKLKSFFDSAVRSFQPKAEFRQWVDDLSAAVAKGYRATPVTFPETRAWFSAVEEPLKYTTRVLERLPRKEFLNRNTVIAEINRPDVRQQEREIFTQVLHEFPEGPVHAGMLKQKVLAQVMPLTQQNLFNTMYNGYGYPDTFSDSGPMGIIDVNGFSNDRNPADVLSLVFGPESRKVAMSTIWQVPVPMPAAPHFVEAINYWAHTREILTERGEVVTELQSDIEQQGGERALISKQIVAVFTEIKEDLLDLVHPEGVEWDSAYKQVEQLIYTKINNLRQDLLRVFDVPDLMVRLRNRTRVRGARNIITPDTVREVIDLKIAENQKSVDVSPKALPKAWQALLVRERIAAAARRNAPKVWFPGRSAVIAIEGWPTFMDITSFFDKGSLLGLAPSKDVRVMRADISYPGEADTYLWYTSPNGNRIREPIDFSEFDPDDEYEGRLMKSYQNSFSVKANFDVLMPEHEAVLANYEKGVYPVLMKEYGAKRVSSGPGVAYRGNFPLETHEPLEWYEVDITDEIAERPIRYFTAAENMAVPAAQKLGLDEVPAAIRVLGSWVGNLLQINQMAKLWPNLPGLRHYQRGMQSLHALKSMLLEQPSTILKTWHDLSGDQASRVEKFLQDEFQSEAHSTILEPHPVTGEPHHVPTELFLRQARDAGLNQAGIDLVLKIKNSFASTLSFMETVLIEQVQRELQDNPPLAAAQVENLKKEFERLRGRPFLPQERFGKYIVQIHAGYARELPDGRVVKKGELLWYEKFESERDQKKALDDMRGQLKGTLDVVSATVETEHQVMYSGLPGKVVDSIISVLDQNDATRLTDEQREALRELQYEKSSTGSFARKLREGRKGVGGGSGDLRRAFAAYHWKMANALARLKYNRVLRNAMDRVKKAAVAVNKTGGVSNDIMNVHNALQTNYAHMMDPKNEWPKLRAFVSLWYLVGSVKTALMNFTSVPILTYPYLAARFGDRAALTEMLSAMRMAKLYFTKSSKVPKDIDLMIKKALDVGAVDQSYVATLAGVADGGVGIERIMPRWLWVKNRKAQDSLRSATWKIISMGMAPFRAMEQFNRLITMIAAYNLAVKDGRATVSSGSTDAFDFAVEATTTTQNEYGSWNQPRIMQGGLSVATLFYSFMQNMSFFMFGGDRGWWRAMLVLAAGAGLLGLPGVENIIDILNWAYRKITGQYVDLRAEARHVLAEIGANPDLVLHGLSHNMFGLGWDASGSLGLGRIVPGTDAIFGVGKFEQRFVAATGEVGGPVGSLMMAFLQAIADDSPNELLRWDRMLPTAVRNIERAWVAHESDAWIDRKGRPLVEGAHGVEILGQILGFTPSRKAEKQEQLRLSRDAVEFYSWRRTNLLEMYYEAWRARNQDALQEVRDAIRKYNEQVPDRNLRVEAADIQRSVKQRQKMDAATSAGRSPQKRYQQIYENIGATYSE